MAAHQQPQLYFFRTMSNGEDGADDCELGHGCPFCGNCILWDADGPPRAGTPAYCNKEDCEQYFVFEDPRYRPGMR